MRGLRASANPRSGLNGCLRLLRCAAVLALIFASSICLKAQKTRDSNPPCPTPNTPAGWKMYVNKKYRFCFSYPPSYAPAAEPWLEKYTNSPEFSKILRSAAEEGREFRLINNHVSEALINPQFPYAEINVYLRPDAFNLQNFVAEAPMGSESPPAPRKFGNEVFYYYGPGGGGVAYPDGFYYDLNGKTLTFEFNGPYANDKTPTPETKKIEEEMLATFRTF